MGPIQLLWGCQNPTQAGVSSARTCWEAPNDGPAMLEMLHGSNSWHRGCHVSLQRKPKQMSPSQPAIGVAGVTWVPSQQAGFGAHGGSHCTANVLQPPSPSRCPRGVPAVRAAVSLCPGVPAVGWEQPCPGVPAVSPQWDRAAGREVTPGRRRSRRARHPAQLKHILFGASCILPHAHAGGAGQPGVSPLIAARGTRRDEATSPRGRAETQHTGHGAGTPRNRAPQSAGVSL